ncbi:MAG: 2-C-methyl-D-erythritol 2,4-cyclodiphosphate synthase [Bacteroidetes bacterium 4572_77]|nr:MAG: 2-C-methyl-D-erythritol 2,4-cyclodiphosphate synthase [Bacteroidetes bacterium 4572_77]
MVGFGYDIHRLAADNSLILGGITIDSPIGTIAHSDGDVLIHAIIDALLGASGLGDIGELFPDTDMKYKNVSSVALLENVMEKISEAAFDIINIDCQIVLEAPKLKQYKSEIKKNIARICQLSNKDRVSIKATTHEKLGPLGKSEGIAVYAIAQLKQRV